MKITDELISEIAAKACEESHRPGSIFSASPWDCAKRAARIALERALTAAPASAAEPVAWRMRDYPDGEWQTAHRSENVDEAWLKEVGFAIVEPLYVGPEVTP